jgi:hypothetical protein
MLPIPARAGRRRNPSHLFGTRIAFINWIHPFKIQPLVALTIDNSFLVSPVVSGIATRAAVGRDDARRLVRYV